MPLCLQQLIFQKTEKIIFLFSISSVLIAHGLFLQKSLFKKASKIKTEKMLVKEAFGLMEKIPRIIPSTQKKDLISIWRQIFRAFIRNKT